MSRFNGVKAGCRAICQLIGGVIVALAVTVAAQAADIATLTLLAPEGRPYNFVEEGEIKGMFAELVQEAFRRAELKIEIHLLPWARCMEEVRRGRADGFYVIYKTPERAELYNFSSESLEDLHETFYVRRDTEFDPSRDFPVLRRKRVGILEYTKHSERMTRAMQNGEIATVVTVNSYENLARMLDSGRLDVVLAVRDAMSDAVAELGLQDHIKQVEPEIDVIPSFLVFTKARDMTAVRDRFDQALRRMKEDGSYARIVTAYARQSSAGR